MFIVSNSVRVKYQSRGGAPFPVQKEVMGESKEVKILSPFFTELSPPENFRNKRVEVNE